MNWQKSYNNWKKKCIEELQELGYNIKAKDVEICEDGCIHFKGNFYLTDKLVTAWKDSEFYLPLPL